jgi:hypothetical protein
MAMMAIKATCTMFLSEDIGFKDEAVSYMGE